MSDTPKDLLLEARNWIVKQHGGVGGPGCADCDLIARMDAVIYQSAEVDTAMKAMLLKCREEFCWHGNTGKSLNPAMYEALVDEIDVVLENSAGTSVAPTMQRLIMSDTQTQTPRTDAFHDGWDSYNYPMDAIGFASQLERENAELLAELQRVADTFADLERASRILRKHAIADSAKVAGDSARAAVAKAKP